MCPLLASGTDNPSEVKWFTAAVRLRGVLLGIGSNSLLRRAWRIIFKKDLNEAVGKASQDDLADWSDQKAGTRKRHRKASVVAAVQYIFNYDSKKTEKDLDSDYDFLCQAAGFKPKSNET